MKRLLHYLRRALFFEAPPVGGPQRVPLIWHAPGKFEIVCDPTLVIPPMTKATFDFKEGDSFATVTFSPLPENDKSNEAEKPAGGNT